jgi:hypothetical protein
MATKKKETPTTTSVGKVTKKSALRGGDIPQTAKTQNAKTQNAKTQSAKIQNVQTAKSQPVLAPWVKGQHQPPWANNTNNDEPQTGPQSKKTSQTPNVQTPNVQTPNVQTINENADNENAAIEKINKKKTNPQNPNKGYKMYLHENKSIKPKLVGIQKEVDDLLVSIINRWLIDLGILQDFFNEINTPRDNATFLVGTTAIREYIDSNSLWDLVRKMNNVDIEESGDIDTLTMLLKPLDCTRLEACKKDAGFVHINTCIRNLRLRIHNEVFVEHADEIISEVNDALVNKANVRFLTTAHTLVEKNTHERLTLTTRIASALKQCTQNDMEVVESDSTRSKNSWHYCYPVKTGYNFSVSFENKLAEELKTINDFVLLRLACRVEISSKHENENSVLIVNFFDMSIPRLGDEKYRHDSPEKVFNVFAPVKNSTGLPFCPIVYLIQFTHNQVMSLNMLSKITKGKEETKGLIDKINKKEAHLALLIALHAIKSKMVDSTKWSEINTASKLDLYVGQIIQKIVKDFVGIESAEVDMTTNFIFSFVGQQVIQYISSAFDQHLPQTVLQNARNTNIGNTNNSNGKPSLNGYTSNTSNDGYNTNTSNGKKLKRGKDSALTQTK